MHDKFEKEVQHKMEELNLAPSAPVWEKIELQIRPEKKRRRAIFWFVFTALLLVGGVIWWNSQPLAKTEQTSAIEKSNQPSVQSSSDREQNKTLNHSTITTSSQNSVTQNPVSNQVSKKEAQTIANTALQNSLKKKLVSTSFAKTKPTASYQSAIVATKQKPGSNYPPQQNNQEVVINSSTNKSAGNIAANNSSKETVVTSDKPFNQPTTADSVAKQLLKDEVLPPAIDSSLKKKVASSKKWKAQVLFTVGATSFASGLFSFEKSAMRDAGSPSNIGSGGVGINPPTANYYVGSPVKGGLSFSFGYGWSKDVNKHWEVSAGIQYSHYTTRQKVGEKIDTGMGFSSASADVTAYYTNTNKNTYTNRFHVIELPFALAYRPSVKLPLFISAGVSYGRLIATNALAFSTTANVYYKNSQAINHNFVPLHVAVQYRFITKKGLQFGAGPVLQYDVQKLYKESSASQSHLAFIGIKTALRF